MIVAMGGFVTQSLDRLPTWRLLRLSCAKVRLPHSTSNVDGGDQSRVWNELAESEVRPIQGFSASSAALALPGPVNAARRLKRNPCASPSGPQSSGDWAGSVSNTGPSEAQGLHYGHTR